MKMKKKIKSKSLKSLWKKHLIRLGILENNSLRRRRNGEKIKKKHCKYLRQQFVETLETTDSKIELQQIPNTKSKQIQLQWWGQNVKK